MRQCNSPVARGSKNGKYIICNAMWLTKIRQLARGSVEANTIGNGKKPM